MQANVDNFILTNVFFLQNYIVPNKNYLVAAWQRAPSVYF